MRGTTATMSGGGGGNGRQPSLPYRIPGPAGFGFGGTCPPVGADATPSQVAAAVHNESRDRVRPFETVAWHSLLQAGNLRPYGTELLSSSVALVKSEALRQVSVKSRLAVRIEKLSYVGKDASVTLADPTGSISGTVHAEVFKDRNSGVEEGAVLLLKNVAAQHYRERSQAGFHADENDALHLSVQPANIDKVFKEKENLAELPRKDGVLPYVESALHPPKVTRQTGRRRRTPLVPARSVERTSSRMPIPMYERLSNVNRSRPQSGNVRSPQMAPPGQNYGGGPNRAHSLEQRTAYRGPPVQRSGMHAPRTPLHRPNSNVRNPHEPYKRPGSHPLQSPKPVQRPRYVESGLFQGASQQTSQQTEPAHTSAADTLTDDQLDSLLGNVDIEAAIAAATQKSASQENVIDVDAIGANPTQSEVVIVPAVAPSPHFSAPPKNQVPKTSALSQSMSAAVVPSVVSPSRPVLDKDADKSVISSTQLVSSSAPGATESVSTVPKLPLAPEANSGGIGAIDDSMLDSLLDGMDTEDFA